MADEDGEEEFDKLDHIINSSGCAKELELSKGNFPRLTGFELRTVRTCYVPDHLPFAPMTLPWPLAKTWISKHIFRMFFR